MPERLPNVVEQAVAAAKLEVSRVTLSRIVNGYEPNSMNMALKMEALGWATADIWLKYQLDYDLAQARKRLNQPLAKAPAVLRRKKMPDESTTAKAAWRDVGEEERCGRRAAAIAGVPTRTPPSSGRGWMPARASMSG